MGRDHGFDRLDPRYHLRRIGQDALVLDGLFDNATIERPFRIPGILRQAGILTFRSRRDGVFVRIRCIDVPRSAPGKRGVEAKNIEADNVDVREEASRQQVQERGTSLARSGDAAEEDETPVGGQKTIELLQVGRDARGSVGGELRTNFHDASRVTVGHNAELGDLAFDRRPKSIQLRDQVLEIVEFDLMGPPAPIGIVL